jgi:hypothetical protein
MIITIIALKSSTTQVGSMGLGKATEFNEQAEAATSERKKLLVEKLLTETKEEGIMRVEEAERVKTIAR